VPRAVGQHGEHRHLTVVHLAQAPAPLPGNANRAIALLDEAALVDEQRAVRLAAQQAVGVTADLVDDRFVPSRRVADEMLELLRAAVLNHGGHRGERGRLRLRKAMQVALCHQRVVVSAAAEEPAVAVNEARERIGDAIDQRSAQWSSAHTLTRRIDPLTSPLPVPNVLQARNSACNPDVKRSGDFASCAPRAVSAWWLRTQWPQPAASISDGTFQSA